MPMLHLPKSPYDCLVCDFPNDLLDTVGDHGLRPLWLQYIQASYDFLIRLSSTFRVKNALGDRTEVAGSPQALSGDRSESVRCPYGVPRTSN